MQAIEVVEVVGIERKRIGEHLVKDDPKGEDI